MKNPWLGLIKQSKGKDHGKGLSPCSELPPGTRVLSQTGIKVTGGHRTRPISHGSDTGFGV